MIEVAPYVWSIDAATTAKPLDAAIAAAPAIDRRDGAKDLRVRSPFEREQERLRLAEYFRKNGVI